MTSCEQMRALMVDNQLRTSGVLDWRILAQMGAVPRENFVPEDRRSTAYSDGVQWLGPVGRSRFVAPPAVFGKLVQLAEIKEHETVLDIGAASGYSTAVLAGLAESVFGFEPDADLAAQAAQTLAGMGLANASVGAELGDALYDVVIVEGALHQVPPQYLARLKDGGRLVALIQAGAVAVANVLVNVGGKVSARREFNASLPLLPMAAPVQEFVF